METSLESLGTLQLLFALLGFMYGMEEKLLSQKWREKKQGPDPWLTWVTQSLWYDHISHIASQSKLGTRAIK